LKTTYKHLRPLFVSAKTNEWVEELKTKILTFAR
jgi:hypothetical protein